MPPAALSNPSSSATSSGLPALLKGAAFAPLTSMGWVRVTGNDRVRWLNGMVTNSIQALQPGGGCYSFVLNAQGRIQGDLIAWMFEDSILLETGRPCALAAWLDHYIIMDDVELVVRSASKSEAALVSEVSASPGRAGLLIAGPNAASTLTAMLSGIELPPPMHFVCTAWQSATVEIFHAHSPLVPRFELWSDNSQTLDNIAAALLGDNLPQASQEDLEHLRILEGAPLYGTDIRDKELPQETAQTRALHFSKGCYLGQEIVERIHSRGAVHRTFAGFLLEGDIPSAGTRLFNPDEPERPVGELISAARIHLAGGAVSLALGYIRRDVLERKATLVYSGGNASAATLPFSALAHVAASAVESASDSQADTSTPTLTQQT